jgi:hypothetical protein
MTVAKHAPRVARPIALPHQAERMTPGARSVITWLSREFIDPANLALIAIGEQSLADDVSIEVVHRDCSRQVHHLFPCDERGLEKVQRIRAIYARVEAEIRARLPDNAMEVSNG